MSAPPAGSGEDFDEIFRKQREESLEKMEELEKKKKDDVRGKGKEKTEAGDPHAIKGNEKGISASRMNGCQCKPYKCCSVKCNCYKYHVGCSDKCKCTECRNPFGTRRVPVETNKLHSSLRSGLSSSLERHLQERKQTINLNLQNLGKRNREESAWGSNYRDLYLDFPLFPPYTRPFSSSNTSHVQPTMQVNNAVRPSSTSLPDLNMPASPSSPSSFTQWPLSSPNTSHFQPTMEMNNVVRPRSTSFQDLNSPDWNSRSFPPFPPSFAQWDLSSSNTRHFQPTMQINNTARPIRQVLPLQVQHNFQSNHAPPTPPSSVTWHSSSFNTSQVQPTMQMNNGVRPNSTQELPLQVQAPQGPSLSWNQGSNGSLNSTEEEDQDDDFRFP